MLSQTNALNSFNNNRDHLNILFSESAFRRGTSAFRFGLIPEGPSDHLPFLVQAPDTTFVSWNLLADDHLYNNFMNISGSQYWIEAIKRYYPAGNSYYTEKENKLFYFFAELAQYLYKNRSDNEIEITDNLLRGFVSLRAQSSNLARSRTPEEAAKKAIQLEIARAQLIHIFIQETQLALAKSSYAHEFKLSIKHSLELIHHIQHSNGSLKWVNRFQLIKKNQALVNKLISADFICLQECTDPNDMLELFRLNNKSHRSITYRINDQTNDHCVLMYDNQKFALIGNAIQLTLEKKPSILAKFQNRSTHNYFIVGSIHHPGGHANLIEKLLEQANHLKKNPEEALNFYLLGDYNHPADFFQHPKMIYPTRGTMAGSDYGNINRSIDAVLTNQLAPLTAKVIEELKISAPAQSISLAVKFKSPQTIAYPGFFQRVERGVDNPPNSQLRHEAVAELLGVSTASRGPLVPL